MKKVLLALLSVLAMSAAFAQAPKTTYNLTMTSYNAEYYAEDGDWYCTLQDENGNGFAFDIYTTTLVSGQTYTFSDMDDYYSYAMIGEEELDYTDATFTYTVANGTESVVAMAALSNGDVYNLTYSRVLPVAEDTVTVTIPSVTLNDYTTSNGVFQMVGMTADESYYATVAIYSSSVVGSYTDNDFYSNYTWLAHLTATDTTYMDFESGNATVTATATGYSLEAYLLCNDNVCYHILMTYTAPVANDTVDVVIPASTFNDYSAYDGSYQFVGASADSTAMLAVNYYASQVTGSFTWSDCDPSYSAVVYNGESKQVSSANFTVTATANGYFINGYFLCNDNVCYHFTMTYAENGINTVSNAQVRVYPNPATDVLHVEANGINRIEVIDLAGRIALTSTQNVNTINVSGLANGVYMLRTTTTEGVNVQKIVKK